MASSPATSDLYEFMWAPSPSPRTPTSTEELAPAKIYPNLSPPLIAMVAVIGTAVLIVLYARILSLHIRRLRRQWRRYRRRRRLLLSTSSGDLGSPPPNSNAFSLDPSSADYYFSPYGLDESAIKSLPLSIFILKKSTLTRDCAVCLLEFEDGDSLRTLPLCSHAFHVDCIDIWLGSHATCPLCRASVFRQDPLFIPMRAARIRPSLDDLMFDPPPEPMPEPEIGPAVSSPPADRNFLLKRSYSFGFERNLAADRMVMDASTASPWRYRHRGSSFWSKRWPSPFTGSSSASRASRVFSFRSHRGFAIKSPFLKRRGFFPFSESSGVRSGGGAGPSSRRSRAMTSPSAIFMRSMVAGLSSSRMRCGDPEALLSPERLGGGKVTEEGGE